MGLGSSGLENPETNAGGNGQITLAGTLQSTAGIINTINLNSTESGAGTGGIVQAAGAVTATNVFLADGLAGAGTFDIGSAATNFLTVASNLTANTTGNVYLNNTGSVSLGNSSAGNGDTFSLITTADAGGDGQITLAGTVQSAVGIINTINLNSTESGAGTGGIVQTVGAVTATNVFLADGLAGAGTFDIGSAATNFLTVASNLTANTNGNVFINNTGSVSLGNSSAGSGDTFSLVTTADAGGNGQITLAGTLQSTAGLINDHGQRQHRNWRRQNPH